MALPLLDLLVITPYPTRPCKSLCVCVCVCVFEGLAGSVAVWFITKGLIVKGERGRGRGREREREREMEH